MAAKKKESEGIALLSMYGDEDDDIEEDFGADQESDVPQIDSVEEPINTLDDSETINSDRISNFESEKDNTPPIFSQNSSPKPLNSTPQQPQNQLSTSSPHSMQQLPIALDSIRSRTGRLTIVDYGHDEAALSPEAEDGEIVAATGHVMFGTELHMSNGEFQEQTPQGTIWVLTPNTQSTPTRPSEQNSLSQNEAMECTVNESAEVEGTIEESKDADPLESFLPPPPKVKCSDELQEKIIKFLSLKKTTGRSFNAEVRNRKEYRNPDFLLHAVTYQDIDQIGTCFSKDVFDPRGYDKSDYYDEIEVDMKREMERKVQEKKKSPKVEYISGGAQPGTVVPTPKVNLSIPGISSVAGGGLLSAPAAVDTVVRDGRPNKKSKWDKMDGDCRNPLPNGGQDSASASLLSAANAVTGYMAFAQQRRREAEDKRSSVKKLERRS